MNIKRFVVDKFNFPTDGEHSMKTLTDDNEDAMPTKQNIVRALQWLVEGAQSSDSLFFHYSGHGGHQSDTGNALDVRSSVGG